MWVINLNYFMKVKYKSFKPFIRFIVGRVDNPEAEANEEAIKYRIKQES